MASIAETAAARPASAWAHEVAAFSRDTLGRPLRPYQEVTAGAIAQSVMEGRGLTFTVMMARQMGKNELSAHLEAWLLYRFAKTGGTIVKAAPTFRPQIVTSMLRLEACLQNAQCEGRWRRERGYMLAVGQARISFYSAEPHASVVGATASLLLEIDEAQDVPQDKFTKDFRPMASSTNATTVLYGTAWTDDTLLERQKQANLELEAQDEARRHFEFDWRAGAAANPAYQQFVAGEIARLGSSHPLIRTQYLLECLHGGGGFFSPEQRLLLRGTHPRQHEPLTPLAQEGREHRSSSPPTPPRTTDDGLPSPRVSVGEGPGVRAEPALVVGGRSSVVAGDTSAGTDDLTGARGDATYVAAVDVAGAAEEAADGALRALAPRKDSTVVGLARLTPVHDGGPPLVRLVEIYWWTGRPLHEQCEQLIRLLRDAWRCRRVVVDASGLGADLAGRLERALGAAVVEPFVFGVQSKSRLAYHLLAHVNSGRLQMWAEGTPHTPEAAEFWREVARVRPSLRAGNQLGFYVSEGQGHDDFVTMLALLAWAARDVTPAPALTMLRPKRWYASEGRY